MDYGIIVDVETTGLEPNHDSIIEIGICEFGWTKDEAPKLLSTYGALQDPGIAIPSEITKLTGITNACLRDQAIDWRVVRQSWDRAQIVIAHNAEFDRGFLQNIAELRGEPKHWACSVRHIDWVEKGFGTRKLQYLAAEHGFVNPFAHRAVFDCATTFRLIQPHMAELVKRSYEPEIRFYAVGSPFESKDILKAHHYRWDTEKRVWHKTVVQDHAERERAFLAEKVYRGQTRHTEETIWFNADAS